MTRIPICVVIGTDPQSGAIVPLICNEDETVAKLAMDEMIDSVWLGASLLSAAERESVQQSLNSLRIVDGILEIEDHA